MMKNKEFKIVKILDEYNVVINAGTNHDLKQSDQFQIIDKEGSEVIDPDTQEVIGTLDLIKATVEVTELHEKMCICSSKQSIKMNSLLSSTALSTGINSIADGFAVSEQEKLNVDLKQVTGGKRKSNKKIRLGDTARLLKTK